MSDPTKEVPAGTPIGFPDVAPVSWVPTDKTPDDNTNPNRALLMGANSPVPQLVANALNAGYDARKYALTNLIEPESQGMATASNGMARLFDSTYVGAFASTTFTALLTEDARAAVADALRSANIGGPPGVAALFAQMGLTDADTHPLNAIPDGATLTVTDPGVTTSTADPQPVAHEPTSPIQVLPPGSTITKVGPDSVSITAVSPADPTVTTVQTGFSVTNTLHRLEQWFAGEWAKLREAL